MIEWTDELIAQIGSYSRAALSYPGLDGYPVTLPLPFTFDRGEHRFTFPRPSQSPAISAVVEGSHSLTLLRYDPQLVNERYLLFYGQLAEQGDGWSCPLPLHEWCFHNGEEGEKDEGIEAASLCLPDCIFEMRF